MARSTQRVRVTPSQGLGTATVLCAVALAICPLGCGYKANPQDGTPSVKKVSAKTKVSQAQTSQNKRQIEASLKLKRIRTDSPKLAVNNLLANIRGVEKQLEKQPKSGRLLAKAAHYHLQRARFLGQVDGYLKAAALGESATQSRSADGKAYLLRATTRSALHRFREALADLVEAEARGLGGSTITAKRESIELAMGRIDKVLPVWSKKAIQRIGSSKPLWQV